MIEYENKLKLSLYLALKGISTNAQPTVNDYKSIKLQLKKEAQLILTINQIDLLVIELIKCSLSKEIDHLDKTSAIEVYTQCMREVKPQIEMIISKGISDSDYLKIIRLMVQSMTVFNIHKQKIPVEQSTDKSIYSMTQNNSVRLSLNTLFNRTLTESEFLLIFEPWFTFMYLAQDVGHNTRFVEQINETRNELIDQIKLKQNEIKINDLTITQLTSFKSFAKIDINPLQIIRDQNIEQLSYYINLEQSLKLSNGKPLNPNNLKENAYFAVLFCAELLGLSAPEKNKNGNLLLTFLDILLGLSERGVDDEGDIRNRLSSIYKKYKAFKFKTQEIEVIMTTLIQCARDNPKCIHTLTAASKIFQSKLQQLNLQPSISLISKDT